MAIRLSFAARSNWALVLVAAVALGCTQQGGPAPASAPASLSVDSRGGPAVIIRINRGDVSHLRCQGGAILSPGQPGIPTLPWDLEVSRESNGQILFAQQITQLPQWLLIFGERFELSASPILGPAGPPCPSG